MSLSTSCREIPLQRRRLEKCKTTSCIMFRVRCFLLHCNRGLTMTSPETEPQDLGLTRAPSSTEQSGASSSLQERAPPHQSSGVSPSTQERASLRQSPVSQHEGGSSSQGAPSQREDPAYPSIISSHAGEQFCSGSRVQFSKYMVQKHHSLFRSLACGICHNPEDFEFLLHTVVDHIGHHFHALRYRLQLSWLRPFGTFLDYRNHVLEATDCPGTIELQVFCHVYSVTLFVWSPDGHVLRTCGLLEPQCVVVHVCEIDSGYEPLMTESSLVIDSFRCTCNQFEHFKKGNFTCEGQACGPDEATRKESVLGEDAWETMLKAVDDPWTEFADVTMIEDVLQRRYSNTCPAKVRYIGIRNDENGGYCFEMMGIVFHGFLSAWSAAIFREYSRYRVPNNRGIRVNFIESVSEFWVNGHIVLEEAIECAVHWEVLVLRQCAKGYIKLAKENCTQECVVCHTLHFRSNVVAQGTQGRKRGHESIANIPNGATGSDVDVPMICTRCVRQKRGKEKFSEHNGMQFPVVPEFLRKLNSLEEKLVSPYLAFMKVKLLRAGQQRALVGGVVVVPLDVFQVVKQLPQTLHMCQAVMVSLKRKLQFKHAHIQEHVRVALVKFCLKYLVETSPLYKEVRAEYSEEAFQQLLQEVSDSIQNVEGGESIVVNNVDQEDLAQEHISFFSKYPTCELPDTDTIQLAPCENKKPVGILSHDHLEELAFPSLYGGNVRPCQPDMTERSVMQWQLTHEDRRYANHPENIFFKFYKLLVSQVNSVIWTRSRQSTLQHFQAGELRHGQVLQSLFTKGLLYNEFKRIRGTPHYWAEAKRNLFAMIRQLKSPPTFFVSLSMADTHWYELIQSLVFISKKKQVSPDDVKNMSFEEKMSFIREDPVTCARYFHHRRKAFIKHCMKDGNILGTLTDYFGVVEFQFRGSPHLHMLVWIKEAATFHTIPDEKTLCSFIDKHIQCNSDCLPEEARKWQTHNHTHRCHRKKNGRSTCAFGFPHPPMPETKILSPLAENTPSDELSTLQELNTHIMQTLESSQVEDNESFSAFLKRCGIVSIERYYKALRSKLRRSRVFHKRACKDKLINPFNRSVVCLWKANMDIQFCLHPHAVGNYIANYMCKGNKALSKVLHDTIRSLQTQSETLGSALKLMANDLLRKQEISIQEAVFHILSLPLRFSSRGCTFINTNTPDKRVVILKHAKEIEQLSEGEEVFHRNAWIQHYESRHFSLEHLCLADFAAWYSIVTKNKPSVTDDMHIDEDEEEELPGEENTREVSELVETTGTRKILHQKRRFQRIIRFVNFPRDETNIDFLIERLLLFVPFRQEAEVIVENPRVLYMAHRDQILSKEKEYCPHYDSWEKVLQTLEDENEQHSESLEVPSRGTHEDEDDVSADLPEVDDITVSLNPRQMVLRDVRSSEDLTTLLRLLNRDQRDFVHHVMHHVRKGNEPLRLFLSGGAGVGKSLTIEALCELLTKFFSTEEGMRNDSIKVLKIAPTGVAAFHIGGYTVHSAMKLGARPFDRRKCKDEEKTYVPLGPQQLAQLAYNLKDVRVIIADENSMFGGTMWDHVSARMQDIKKCLGFCGDLHVIMVGDLFQLPPVLDQWCFEVKKPKGDKSLKVELKEFWRQTKMFELTKIMRQKDSMVFAERLNRLREGRHTAGDIAFFMTLTKRSATIDPKKTMHLFSTNDKVNAFNKSLYESVPPTDKIEIPAEDIVGSGMGRRSFDGSETSIPEKTTDTHGLASLLQLFRGCVVMMTTNVNVEDGLVNGSCGILQDITYGHTGKVQLVWVHFYEGKVGAGQRSRMHSKYSALPHISRDWTPVERVERSFLDKAGIENISRKQFPIAHRNASTIHKTQGLTLQTGLVDFSGDKIPGLVYVALSRFVKPDAVQLVSFSSRKIGVNSKVLAEMSRLRSEQMLRIVPKPLWCISTMPGFKLLYQNVRSLRKHRDDLAGEEGLACFDVICLVETHWHHASSEFVSASLPKHSVFSKEQKFGCGVFSKHPLLVCYEKSTDTFDALCVFVNPQVSSLIVCTLYFHPNCSSKEICEEISSMFCSLLLLSGANEFLIVGDFNAHLDSSKFNDMQKIFDANDIKRVPTDQTTVFGSTIDHLWRSSSLHVLESTTHECWYSDHFPLSLVLSSSIREARQEKGTV